MSLAHRRFFRRSSLIFAIIFQTLLFSQSVTSAEDEKSAPQPVTVSNPEIPVEQLKLLLKPLTAEELAVEAEGWRDLLKSKVSQISQSEINDLKSDESSKKATATQSTEKNEQEKDKQEKDENGHSDEGENSHSSDEHAEESPETSQPETISLATLIQQRSELDRRMDVVLTEWELKGGDPKSYRKYMSAVSGLNVDVSDASQIWLFLRDWLFSKEGGLRWAWNVAKFLLLLLAFWILARILSRIADHAVKRWGSSRQLLRDFVSKMVRKGVLAVGLVVAVSALEVDITPLLAVIGAAGLVVGLALQGTLSNFASGLLILAYRPFDTGDVIEAGGVSGTVKSMNLLSTHVNTFDNKHVIVPNNDIWSSVITNATATNIRRVDMVFGIGYDDDIDKAEQIMTRVATDHELTLSDPEPVIKLNELADSSVNFICRPWCKTNDYWTVYWDITKTIKKEFDKSGISIPYPQQDVHLFQNSNSGST